MRSEWLRTRLRDSDRRASTFVPGGRAEECDDTHLRNGPADLHPPSGWGLMNPSPPRERNSPDRPPQSSGGPAARPEELTRGAEIPSQLGGSASTRGPERTAPPREQDQPEGRYDKLELATRPSRARTTEPTNRHHLGDGMDRRDPSLPGS